VSYLSEIITKRLRESKGKRILVFLKNNFRYEGKLIDSDDSVFEFFDYREKRNMIKSIADIRELEVESDGEV